MRTEVTAGAGLSLLAVLPTLRGGGSERVMSTLLRHLDCDCFRASLAVVDGSGADLAGDLPVGLHWIDLGYRRVLHAVPALLQLIRKRRPRVVLSTLGHLNLILALLKPLLPRNVRVVARESSIVSEMLQRERHSAAWRLAFRLFYRRLDLIICQSHAMQDDLCRHFGVPAARTVVIPNPLDLQRIRRMAAESLPSGALGSGVRLLAVGRLSAEKGFDVLLRALARSGRQDLCLDLLGQGPEEATLRKLTTSLGLEQRVRFHGFQSNPYAWMRHADALVLSSRYEGLPNVVLEALACGTPVITTPVPSAIEIVADMPQAVVAEGFGETEIAAALQRWLNSARSRVPAEAMARYEVLTITKRYEEALQHAASL